MRTTGLLLAFLLAAPAAASAHDVRLADGSLWAHDHAGSWFTGSPVRNVSVTVPQVTDCAGATWPDIPVSCLAPARPVSAAPAPKSDRLRTAAAPKGSRLKGPRLAAPRIVAGFEAVSALDVQPGLSGRVARRQGT